MPAARCLGREAGAGESWRRKEGAPRRHRNCTARAHRRSEHPRRHRANIGTRRSTKRVEL